MPKYFKRSQIDDRALNQDITHLFDAVNRKPQIYIQSTTPTGSFNGDIWIKGTELYIKVDDTWESVALGSMTEEDWTELKAWLDAVTISSTGSLGLADSLTIADGRIYGANDDYLSIGFDNAYLTFTVGASDRGRIAIRRGTTGATVADFNGKRVASVPTGSYNYELFADVLEGKNPYFKVYGYPTGVAKRSTDIRVNDSGYSEIGLAGDSLSLKSGGDVDLYFDTATNDGKIKWGAVTDYFTFYDDVLIDSAEALYFRDTSTYIKSANANYMDISAPTAIRVATPITMATDKKVNLRDANSYIQSANANYLDLYGSTGVRVSGNTAITSSSPNTTFTVSENAGQSADAVQVKDSGGNLCNRIDKYGKPAPYRVHWDLGDSSANMAHDNYFRPGQGAFVNDINGMIVPYSGSVTALTIGFRINNPASGTIPAEDITILVRKRSGSTTTDLCSHVVTIGANVVRYTIFNEYSTWDRGTYTFSAGDLLSVQFKQPDKATTTREIGFGKATLELLLDDGTVKSTIVEP